MPERMPEERAGRVHAKVAGLVHDQKLVVLVGDPVRQVGFRLRKVPRKVFEPVVQRENPLRLRRKVVDQNLAPRNALAPLVRAAGK